MAIDTRPDLVIGCFTNYHWDKIQYWVNSLDQSGFTGKKLMVVYNCEFSTAQKLLDRQYNLLAFARDDDKNLLYYPEEFIIVVQRFFNMWNYLSEISIDDYRYIITTDVKDVVFQSNPSIWLEKNLKKSDKIVASSESLHYRDEPWGDENLRNSFPQVYPKIKDKIIRNCGVLAGDARTMRDLFLNIYLLCKGSPVHNPDQAALNVLLNLEPYKNITKFVNSEDGWAAQLGTSADLSKNFTPFLTEPRPKMVDDQITTSKGFVYPIVHQYDRIPEWRPIIEGKYS